MWQAGGCVGGGKLYILGVAGYITIYTHLGCFGARGGAGGGCLYGAKFVQFSQLGKRCQLGLLELGFCSWARWARFFIDKKLYIGKYNTFISITPLSVGQGRQEWVDGIGWTRMTFLRIILP